MSDEPGLVPEESERGKDRARHVPLWGYLAIVAVLGALIYLSRDAIGLAVGPYSAESRPELLRDAKWGKQGSARLFERQFHSGAPESELLSWLNENRFTIDRTAARASRTIGDLPCNERIEVSWAVDNGGRLTGATATVHEAGCL